jgi:phosphatidylinositol alpha-1,6-mannosyltransferase
MPAPHLLLSYDFPPIGGGISRWMDELARRYPDGALVVSTGEVSGGVEADASLPVRVDRVAVPSGRLRTLPGLWRWSRRAVDLADQHGVRFTWCGNLRPAAYPARWLRARRGIPYGVMVHGGDLLTVLEQVAKSPRKRRVARELLGDADIVVANSRWTADRVRELAAALDLPDGGPLVEVVPLGTDPARFHPGLDASAARAEYGLEGGPWLLTVARLVPHKGVDVALEALARLAPSRPGLRYAVAGEGPDRERLEARAAELGVADRVRFLGGVPEQLLPAVYAAAAIYVGLSREEGREVEGFGISFVEASASGLPVVAGRAGGVPDAVRDGETGILVDPRDPGAAALAIQRILEEPDLARRLGETGRRAAETMYNWDRVARTLRALGEAHSAP